MNRFLLLLNMIKILIFFLGRSSGTSNVPKNNINTHISFVKSSMEEEDKVIVKTSKSTTDLSQQSSSTTSQQATQSTKQSHQHQQKIQQSNPLKRKFESHFENNNQSDTRKKSINPGFIIYETIGNPQQSVHTLQISAAKQGADFRCEVEIDQITKQ